MNIRKLNGNDYAWDILKRNAMDARALLKASHDQESVWLELKADPFCRKTCPNGLTDEAVWHTLKAIVAMVNTRGGCIVFGLENQAPHQAVDLYDSTGKPVAGNTLDEFHRNITEMFLRKTKLKILEDDKNEKKEKKNNEKKKRHALSHSIERYCELKAGVYCDGKPLSVLLVRPSDGDDFVWVTVDDKDKKLIVRQPGDNGMCKILEADEIRQWNRPRLDSDDVALDKKFDNMFSPVPEFVGRRDVLDRIERCFMRSDRCTIPLLYGPAGVGKSEVAYKYAAERNTDYDTLIRVDASNCVSIGDVFSKVVANPDFRRVLHLEGRYDAGDYRAEDRLMFVREAIAEGRLGRVLMVIDDVRHPDVVRPSVINRYLGRIFGSRFNIIATTRYPLLKFLAGEMVEPIEIGPLLSQDGVRLLARKRELPGGQGSDCAEAIVRLVGGNPWAIDLVGEYLKQKQRQDASDYQSCLQDLQKSIVDFFPPKEHGTTLAGNATGITDVDALLKPTLSAMRSEERDICTLIAMTWQSRGPESALRAAFERLYGRNLQDDEWRFYIETLKKKCLVGENENEIEAKELFLSDGISAGYFKSEFESKSDRFTDAFLEYIRAVNRLTLADSQCAKGYLDFVVKSNSSKKRKAEVVFDTERYGWPFYFMGVDVRRATSSKMTFGADEISTILELSDGVPAFEADVLEIKHMDDEEDAAEGIHEILRLREKIYADDPIMLGRSFLHAESMGRGGILDLSERFDLLEKAESSFSHMLESDIRSRYLADTLWAKAAVRQEYIDYPDPEIDFTDEDRDECRGEISSLLARAKELWPDIFAEVEDVDAYIEDGVCP